MALLNPEGSGTQISAGHGRNLPEGILFPIQLLMLKRIFPPKGDTRIHLTVNEMITFSEGYSNLPKTSAPLRKLLQKGIHSLRHLINSIRKLWVNSKMSVPQNGPMYGTWCMTSKRKLSQSCTHQSVKYYSTSCDQKVRVYTNASQTRSDVRIPTGNNKMVSLEYKTSNQNIIGAPILPWWYWWSLARRLNVHFLSRW